MCKHQAGDSHETNNTLENDNASTMRVEISKFWLIFVFVIIAGYIFGKDMAMKQNIQDRIDNNEYEQYIKN